MNKQKLNETINVEFKGTSIFDLIIEINNKIYSYHQFLMKCKQDKSFIAILLALKKKMQKEQPFTNFNDQTLGEFIIDYFGKENYKYDVTIRNGTSEITRHDISSSNNFFVTYDDNERLVASKGYMVENHYISKNSQIIILDEIKEEKDDKELNKPFRLPKGSSKKFGVYVKDKDGKIKKVAFGDPDMEIKRDDPKRRKNFRSRHGCDKEKDKTTAKYWSCQMWRDDKSVSDILDEMPHFATKEGSYDLYIEEHLNDTPQDFINYIIDFIEDYHDKSIIEYILKDDTFESLVNRYFGEKTYYYLKQSIIDRYKYDLEEKAIKVWEGKGTKLEEITLFDLFDKDNIAPSTMAYRKERNKIMGAENTIAKLLDIFLNEADNSATIVFSTQATVLSSSEQNTFAGKGVYDRAKKRVSPLNLNLLKNPEKKYEIQIKILEFFDWLDVFDGEKVTRKEIKEILEVSDVQVFSTSPSFQYQGYNYFCSEISASAYKTGIKPQVWDKRLGGEYFLDKHLYGLIRNMKFWYNPIASMLTKKLKDRDLI